MSGYLANYQQFAEYLNILFLDWINIWKNALPGHWGILRGNELTHHLKCKCKCFSWDFCKGWRRKTEKAFRTRDFPQFPSGVAELSPECLTPNWKVNWLTTQQQELKMEMWMNMQLSQNKVSAISAVKAPHNFVFSTLNVLISRIFLLCQNPLCWGSRSSSSWTLLEICLCWTLQSSCHSCFL